MVAGHRKQGKLLFLIRYNIHIIFYLMFLSDLNVISQPKQLQQDWT